MLCWNFRGVMCLLLGGGYEVANIYTLYNFAYFSSNINHFDPCDACVKVFSIGMLVWDDTTLISYQRMCLSIDLMLQMPLYSISKEHGYVIIMTMMYI